MPDEIFPENSEKEPMSEKEFSSQIDLARETAEERLENAGDLVEFINMTEASQALHPDNWMWAREYGPRYSNEWLAEFEKGGDYEKGELYSRVALELLELAMEEHSDDSRVTVAIRRTENGKYFGLAIFPDGYMQRYSSDRFSESSRDIILINFDAACNRQSCDRVLGISTEESIEGVRELRETVFSIENSTINDLDISLGFRDTSDEKKNFVIRDEAGEAIKERNPQEYLLFALKGGFSNETDRYLISDFLARAEN